MSEKVSILTLRLTAEEAAQMEVLKSITGKKSGSEAIKYIREGIPPILCPLQAGGTGEGRIATQVPGSENRCGRFPQSIRKIAADDGG